MGGACNVHGEMRNAYKILVGKPEGKRPLRRWEHNLMDLSEIGLEDVDLINLAQDRNRWLALVNTVMNFGSYKMRRISII
jgi:hypothetical protein